jgi:hypothetical protein
MHFIENGTSGSQNIIISQGSGANVTIPAGDVKAVYLDGAGSGAAVVDAFASLNAVDLKVEDDLTVTDDATIGGTLGVTGVVTANAGVVVDNITIDGTEIDLSSGNLTLDVAGTIKLDADGGEVAFLDAGTEVGVINMGSSNMNIESKVADKDIIFKGIDGSSDLTALTLDMSDAGTALFNNKVDIASIGQLGNVANDLTIYSSTSGHNGLRFHLNGILPTDNAGAIVDNDADLGDPSYRFKDLYLGGSIKLSGLNSGNGLTFDMAGSGDYVIKESSTNDVMSFQGSLFHNFSNNRIGIGTASPSSLLHVDGSFSGTAVTIHNTAGASSSDRGLDVETSSTGTTVQRWINSGTEVARIVGNGDVLFNTTSIAELTKNAFTFDQSEGRVVITSNTGTEPMILNRQASDGTLIEFRQASSVEGAISVSGSTVSYNGFSGTHESSGISTDTAVGTVVSTIDELDTYTLGTKSGQARADHAKIKISDTVGDTRVYGVLHSYSQADNKPLIASVGIGSIKVTGACNGGDLLESNGDGTAKVQSDDIIKSKTIGKVTIGNSETGVKLVSCVLYCG